VKHYSPSTHGRFALLWLSGPKTLTDEDLRIELRDRLDLAGGKAELARELGITEFKLTGVLRGHWTVCDEIAAALGYRKVTRFERIS
jgi:hypothetical protein